MSAVKETPPQASKEQHVSQQRRPRQRKRPLSLHHSNDNLHVTTNVIPLVLPSTEDSPKVLVSPVLEKGWIRIIDPYPWAFTTHAKQRWIGRPLAEVYATDFGAYPPSYYDTAIRQGRILVNDNAVDPDYRVKDKDVLSHCVHRHEPAVAVASPSALVNIVAETNDLLVLDKPPTMPIHPCGGYHKNTLIDILETERQAKLYPIHRLDRLTSGLLLMGKHSAAAKKYISVMQQQRNACEKLYLARVQGRLAAQVPQDLPRLCDNVRPVCGEWPDQTGRAKNAFCYWISRAESDDDFGSDLTLHSFSQQASSLDVWLNTLGNEPTQRTSPSLTDSTLKWLHVACPTRVEQHKNGVCSCGPFDGLDDDVYNRTVKPAETSFALIHYDEATDSSLVLCRPATGRCHQIRLHLQLLGNPIANDPNYGGYIWWNDPQGESDCQRAQALLNSMDGITQQHNATNLDQLQPATQCEVDHLDQSSQHQSEPLDEFIRRTCVWCKRTQGSSIDRSVLEFMSRSPAIYLHALQYTIRTGEPTEYVSFSTDLPAWAKY